MQTHKVMGTKLSLEEYMKVHDYCNWMKTKPSKLIRQLLLDEIGSLVSPSNVAGKNLLEYDKKTDTFTWSVELDSGEKEVVLKNLSPEYLKNLLETVSSALIMRDELQNRKKKASVPVPKKLIRGKR